MLRAKKEELVSALHETFEGAVLLVVTHQHGLTVADSDNLRREMRDAGATFRVIKNRLARLALKDTKFEALSELFSGPTAIAYSQDPVAAARASVAFSKKNAKLEIVGGAVAGAILDTRGVSELAALPSLDELRARLLGMINTPATRIATLMQAPAGQLARVIKAHADTGEAA